MKRFAIYARYSSDHQKETSIEDQIRECTQWVKNRNGIIVKIYKDQAISGGHLVNRLDLQNLIRDSEDNLFDCVIAEDLSRFSRDQEHSAGLFKRFKYNGVDMYTISDNEVTALHIGLKGTVNQIYLTDLADKTRRGQKGAVERGKIPGGISYGYKKVKKYDEHGELISGFREINTKQAIVIRRIFQEYLLGKSARVIASDLNKEGIKSPRGGEWMASTINGNPARQNGILCNMLYTGKIVYNRQKFIKNPDTGKRRAILNPQNEWVINEVPELRIIDQEVWEKVQKMKRSIAGKPKNQQKRKRHLLSGLMKCSECGGSYTVVASGRYGCSHRRERGTCSNSQTAKFKDIEKRILSALENNMITDQLLDDFSNGYKNALKKQRETHNYRIRDAKKELKAVEKKINGILKAIMDGMYSPSMKEAMPPLEHKKEDLIEEIKLLEKENVIQIKPNMATLYKQQIRQLTTSLSSKDYSRLKAFNVVRSLIDEIVVSPNYKKGECNLLLKGDLATILSFVSGEDVLSPVVAGAGFGHKQKDRQLIIVEL
ncbi:recombinase family protein [Tenacibaculum agarivorans]|uniref:recombinase family protein n=1 Tax=Tenacibaculum agarivorans TaxID=1908389 RepID=UPI00094BBC82|nr:recombinase family protein [Tenacibaculum agarivorans]